jgi:hypothetical protein
VSPRAVLDAVVKRKIPSPRRELNSRTPIVQPVFYICIDVYSHDWRHFPTKGPIQPGSIFDRFYCTFRYVKLLQI